jgi:capsular polysaccharide export protein
MYSSLHEKIAKIVAKKKYAITSSWSKKIYLPTFKLTLVASIIKSGSTDPNHKTIEKIKLLSTYHHAYAKKVENRELSADELTYMAKFYLGLKQFIQNKHIDLVLLHNDTRWYHAIAILVCKEMNIKYLVTEQGLIRPNTTMIDRRGINYNASLPSVVSDDTSERPAIKHPHDSVLSMIIFACFLLTYAVEKPFGKQVKYMHNDYRIMKYVIRMLNIFKSKSKNNQETLPENTVLLLLQLELDSQLLIHSRFKNNQEVINLVQKKCTESGLTLKIKKHPLDLNHYQAPSSCYLDGGIYSLAKQASLVVTVNSSAALQVLKTKTPLILLGDSIYHKNGVAQHVNLADISNLKNNYPLVCIEKRRTFIKLISNNYLLWGAGYSYNMNMLEKKLSQLLMVN